MISSALCGVIGNKSFQMNTLDVEGGGEMGDMCMRGGGLGLWSGGVC